MNKVLVFDMDGTIADLYHVNEWLSDLRSYNVRPYVEAKPLYDMERIVQLLEVLKLCGWQIAVTSWLSKESTPEYDEAVKTAKRNWLTRYHFPADKVFLVPYGTEKSQCTKHLGGYQILFDDNEKVRSTWSLGATVNAKENIIPTLIELMLKEM